MNSGNILLLTTSTLVGYRLADDKSFATLPIALQFFSTMLMTIPASMVMKHLGRKTGFIIGTCIGIAGAGLASWAVVNQSFWYFCLAAVMVGMFNGFGTFYRFAAADVATEDYRPTAISYVMAGGVIAAILGPNLANWASGLYASVEFAGSYLALSGLLIFSLFVASFLTIPKPDSHEAHDTGRPLHKIASQGIFIVAMLGAALGYGIMSLVMTATPLAMHHHSHTFSNTTFVIEWHVLGMYAPSFFTGHLIRRFGVLTIMGCGVLLYYGCVLINLNGTDLNHFWIALFMLGIGWNFLFVGGTTLLTEAYQIEEKAKTQAVNDFMVFGMMTVASLSSGALQYQIGWQAINWGVLVPTTVISFAILFIYLSRQRNACVVS